VFLLKLIGRSRNAPNKNDIVALADMEMGGFVREEHRIIIFGFYLP
jgi:hypothetical protein